MVALIAFADCVCLLVVVVVVWLALAEMVVAAFVLRLAVVAGVLCSSSAKNSAVVAKRALK